MGHRKLNNIFESWKTLILIGQDVINWPCVSHQDEGHDGEEHEGDEDEEGQVDGAADVVGERGRGLAELVGRCSTARAVATSVVVAEAWNSTHLEVEVLKTIFTVVSLNHIRYWVWPENTTLILRVSGLIYME